MKHIRLFENEDQYLSEYYDLPYPCVSLIEEDGNGISNLKYEKENCIICTYSLDETVYECNREDILVFSDGKGTMLKWYQIEGYPKVETDGIREVEVNEVSQLIYDEDINDYVPSSTHSFYDAPQHKWQYSHEITNTTKVMLGGYFEGEYDIMMDDYVSNLLDGVGSPIPYFTLSNQNTLVLSETFLDILLNQGGMAELASVAYSILLYEENDSITEPTYQTSISYSAVRGQITSVSLPIQDLKAKKSLSVQYGISEYFSAITNSFLVEDIMTEMDCSQVKTKNPISIHPLVFNYIDTYYVSTEGYSNFRKLKLSESIIPSDTLMYTSSSNSEPLMVLPLLGVELDELHVPSLQYAKKIIPWLTLTSEHMDVYVRNKLLTSITFDANDVYADPYGLGFDTSMFLQIDGMTSLKHVAFTEDAPHTQVTIRNLSNLEELVIGPNITTIDCFNGDKVHMGINQFPHLHTINVLGGNTTYDSRDNCNALIETSTNKLLLSSTNTKVIPNGVTEIDRYAFMGRNELTSINIPNSVTKMGSNCFKGCTNLTNITIGSGLTALESGPFSLCPQIESIIVDPNNTVYDSRENCNAIINSQTNRLLLGCKNTIIPEGVTEILGDTFDDVPYMDVLYIPASVNYLSSWYLPKNVNSIIVDPNNTVYDSRENCNAIIESDTNELIYACKNTVLPSSIELKYQSYIDAFDNIEDVEIVDGLAYVGNIFLGPTDSAITSCHIKEGTEFLACDGSRTMNVNVFPWTECPNLTSLTIPDSVVATLNYHSLSYFPNLKELYIGANFVRFTTSDFYLQNNVLEKITVSKNNRMFYTEDGINALIVKSSNKLILGCKNTVIPEGVVSIGYHAFNNCHGLTAITIPSTVKSTVGNPFNTCTRLVELTIPSSVTSDASFTFSGMTSLTKLTIDANQSNNLLYIGNLPNLQELHIGEDFQRISYGGNTPSLTTISIDSKNRNLKLTPNMDGVINISANTLTLCTANVTSIPDSVTAIGENTFYGNLNLTSITIPSNVSSVGRGAFRDCDNLTNLTISSNNLDCDYSSFPYQTLTSLTFTSDSVLEFDDSFVNIFGGRVKEISCNNDIIFKYEGSSTYATVTSNVPCPNLLKALGNGSYKKNEYEALDLNIGSYDILCVYNANSTSNAPLIHVNNSNSNSSFEYVSLDGGEDMPFNNDIITPQSGLHVVRFKLYESQDGLLNTCLYFSNILYIHYGDNIKAIKYNENYHPSTNGKIKSIFPRNIEHVGTGSFNYHKFESIELPSTLKVIEPSSFYKSTVSELSMQGDNAYYSVQNNCIIETATNTLLFGADMASLPSNIARIEDRAFNYSSASSIVIPEGVKYLGSWDNISNVTSIVLPSTIEYAWLYYQDRTRGIPLTVQCKAMVAPTFNKPYGMTLYYPKGADYSYWLAKCNRYEFGEGIATDFTV